MTLLRELSTGRRIVYIATRLFDFSEKIKAEDMEQAVLSALKAALSEKGLPFKASTSFTFVPFRDTVQNVSDAPVSSIPDLNKEIFEEDIKNLSNSIALVAHFDGLSKDEGVGIEIGYAYGRRIPILLAMTDFVRTAIKDKAQSMHLLDPIIEVMATSVLYQYQIPEGDAAYRDRLVSALGILYSDVERELKPIILNLPDHFVRRDVGGSIKTKQICIEFGGGQFEWQTILATQVSELLEARGYSCVITDRYSIARTRSGNTTSMQALGELDLRKLEESELLITCSDMLEMASGTAALQGYARSLDKNVLLYDSKTTDMVGDNNYKSSRNLMVDNSANATVSSVKDIPKTVGAFFEN